MERHETMMRTARYFVGAGTLAGAMVAMTAGSASAQTTTCIPGDEGNPTFCGHVFTDIVASGNTADTYDEGEEVANVYVAITDASGTNVANSPTPTGACPGENCGYYGFVVWGEPGTEYWICLVTDLDMSGDISDAEKDCHNSTLYPNSVKVTVGESPFHDFEVGDDGSGGEEPPPLVWGSGTGTPGYWKNHSSAWPVSEIVIGDGTPDHTWTYSKEQAIAFLNKPVAGDKTYTIFASLVSAMLNVYNDVNNPTCIADDIAKAHKWFSFYGPVGKGIKAKSDAWVGGPTNPVTIGAGEPIHTEMDDYNNGKLCAPHRN